MSSSPCDPSVAATIHGMALRQEGERAALLERLRSCMTKDEVRLVSHMFGVTDAEIRQDVVGLLEAAFPALASTRAESFR